MLYLGDINASQAAAWRRAVEVVDTDTRQSQTLSLFPRDRCDAVTPDSSLVQLRLSQMRLCRPRQWARAGWPG